MATAVTPPVRPRGGSGRRSLSHEQTDTSTSGWDVTEIPRDEVAHLAKLARIGLNDAELDRLTPQLSVILQSVASIAGIARDDVPPTSHPLPLTNVFRDDIVQPCLTADQALASAPAVEDQRFVVLRILDEES